MLPEIPAVRGLFSAVAAGAGEGIGVTGLIGAVLGAAIFGATGGITGGMIGGVIGDGLISGGVTIDGAAGFTLF